MDLLELKHRIKNAIVLLKEEHPVNVGDLTFTCLGSDYFSVIGWTIKNDLKNITKATALTELNETKELFKKMIAAVSELSDFVKERNIKFQLSFDYGMGGLEICNEIDGELKWITELQK